jgi:Fe(3+) dicitrate transport protein
MYSKYRSHTSFTAYCVLVLALAAQPASAQGGSRAAAAVPNAAGSVAGVVTSVEGGEAMVGVTVELVELRLRRISDARGRYAFSSVPAGTYTLRFSRLGLTVLDRWVEVGAGTAAAVNVALADEAILLDPVMVLMERTRLVGDVARARMLPGSAHVIGQEQLNEQLLAFDDINTILRQVPGVNIQEEEGYGARPNIGLRGTGTERSSKITVMEDGILVAPAPYAAPAAYYFPVVGRMEAVEVRKGSSQVKYGPRTVGGALNLVSTSIPHELRVSLDASGGPAASGKLLARVGDSYRHGGWLVETYNLRTDGFKEIDGTGDSGFRVSNHMAKLRLNTDRSRPGAYHELEFKAGVFDEVANETYLGLTESDFRVTPLRRYAASQLDVLTADQRQLQLRYFVRPLSWLDVTTTAYRNDMSRNWYKLQSVLGRGLGGVLQQPEQYATELDILRGANSGDDALRMRAGLRDYYSQGVQSVVGLRLRVFDVLNDIEVGVRLHEDQEARFQHEDSYRMSGGRMVLTSAGAAGTQENRVSDARATAFYVQNHLSHGRVTLTPGVRHESIEFVRRDYAPGDAERVTVSGQRENGVDVWIPGIGTSVLVRRGVRVFAGVHKGFGPPGPGASEDSRAETSVNYELGTHFQAGNGSVELVGFYSDYANILGAATLSSGGQGTGDLYNGGAVEVLGLEALAEYDVLGGELRRSLPVQLTYTLTKAQFKSAFESAYAPWAVVEVGDRLPYLPEHQLHGSVGYGQDAWRLRLAATYGGQLRTVAGQGAIPPEHTTDAYVVFNLSGEYALSRWGTAYVGVQNLTDERYVVARQPAGARPGLPRTVHAGIRLQY